MSQTYEDLALVLRRVDYAEADVIVDLLTRTHGRISVFARGARKSARRFSGGIEAFTLLRVRIRPGREGALGNLQDSEAETFYASIVNEPLKLSAAAWLLSLVEGITQPGLGGGGFFDFVQTIFRWLNEVASPAALMSGMLRAELVLLQDAGVLASMDQCQVSGAPLGSMASAIFRPGEGLVDAACATLGDQGVRLGRESLALLEAVLSRQVVPTLDGAALHPLRDGLFRSWAQVLDRPPKTWEAWDAEVRRAFPAPH